MPHIQLPDGLPGILGPMKFRPETAAPLNDLAEVLLRGPSSLSRGEREMIAAYVSALNECQFCCESHSAFAALQVEGGRAHVEAVKRDYRNAPISAKLAALLTIAGQVQRGGKRVTAEAVRAAVNAGATDVEVHDTVLIAAAFCMYNRYVDGLATPLPADAASYDMVAKKIVADGYRAAVAQV
jgi:uncharacterized peroxidase-related enzyme